VSKIDKNITEETVKVSFWTHDWVLVALPSLQINIYYRNSSLNNENGP